MTQLSTTAKMKPIHFHIPFDLTRLNDEERMVEGLAFVREVVDGEGGVCLERAAMIEATPDYMKWGALRVMHQPIAAGKTIFAEWRDEGLFIRCHVVDDEAWNKVKTGVYSAFSVGVTPTVMRGLNVKSCVFKEISLVDRPKDADAIITTYRIDTDEECDVKILRSFADIIGELKERDVIDDMNSAWWAFCQVIAPYDGDLASAAEINQSIDEFAAYLKTIAAESPAEITQAAMAVLTRRDEKTVTDATTIPAVVSEDQIAEIKRSIINEIKAELAPTAAEEPAADPAVIERSAEEIAKETDLVKQVDEVKLELERAQSSLSEKETELKAALERVTELENTPVVGDPVVRFAEGSERVFAANEGAGTPVNVAAEIKRLTDVPENASFETRKHMAAEISKFNLQNKFAPN